MPRRIAEKPCDWHVDTEKGKEYCEAGPYGHEGSHMGQRTRAEYVRLLKLWESEPEWVRNRG